jgi:hypothetical protein
VPAALPEHIRRILPPNTARTWSNHLNVFSKQNPDSTRRRLAAAKRFRFVAN